MLNSIKKKRIEEEENNDKVERMLCKLMNNAIYRKTIRNRMEVKRITNEKDYLKCTSKTKIHVAQNI